MCVRDEVDKRNANNIKNIVSNYPIILSTYINSLSNRTSYTKLVYSRYMSHFLDYLRDEIKIDIEYDGSYWHRDQQCDIRRDKFLRDNGFKILRIRSSHKIPTEKELFSSIEYLLNTDCCFKELILSDWNTENICKEVSA